MAMTAEKQAILDRIRARRNGVQEDEDERNALPENRSQKQATIDAIRARRVAPTGRGATDKDSGSDWLRACGACR